MAASHTTLPTCSTMARWNVLEEYSRYTKQMLSVLQAMESVLLVAFGPHGRAALVREPTGPFTVTKTGVEILRACYTSPCPVSCILVSSAHDLYQLCGDGVKSFVIEVSALLRRCVDLNRPSHTARQLMLLQQTLGKVCLRASEKAPRSPDGVLKILTTFLACRLPDSVARSLASLLSRWISALSSIQLAVRKFDLLCLHQCSSIGSVSSSRVQQGFCLTRETLNFLGPGLYNVKIICFGDCGASSGTFDIVDIQYEVDVLIRELKLRSGNEISDVAGILLITPAMLPDLSVFLLRKHGVCIVQGVLQEEVDFVYTLLVKNQQSRLVHVRQEVLGSRECTWLDLPGVSQLVLHAPTRGLGLEYARDSCDALKVLSLADSYYVLAGGGQLESTLLACLQDRFKLQPLCLASGCVVGRSALLEWHRKLGTASSTFPEQNDGELTQMCKSVVKSWDSVDREVIEAVGHALQAILQKLPATMPASGMEPVKLRLMVLQHALAATIALLRVDGVVPVRSDARVEHTRPERTV